MFINKITGFYDELLKKTVAKMSNSEYNAVKAKILIKTKKSVGGKNLNQDKLFTNN